MEKRKYEQLFRHKQSSAHHRTKAAQERSKSLSARDCLSNNRTKTPAAERQKLVIT
jgi:hypothetical protein